MARNPFGIDKEALTTGEVARICNVAARTVSKWIDAGRLEGYRIPGSKDRRVHVATLEAFMRAHGIPIAGPGTPRTRVLVIDADRVASGTLKEVLEDLGTCEVATAADAFGAGLECGIAIPEVLVIDSSATDIVAFAQSLRQRPEFARARLVASGANLPDDDRVLLRAGFAQVLRKHYSVRTLVDAIGVSVSAAPISPADSDLSSA